MGTIEFHQDTDEGNEDFCLNGGQVDEVCSPLSVSENEGRTCQNCLITLFPEAGTHPVSLTAHTASILQASRRLAAKRTSWHPQIFPSQGDERLPLSESWELDSLHGKVLTHNSNRVTGEVLFPHQTNADRYD